jgi:predicted RNA-binding protein with RPS1 domain
MQPDPWQSTVGDLKVGDLVDGTVTKIVNFGAFVRVKDGLEGLIHISELSHQRVAHPGDVVQEGQTLKLKIISLDSERHRLGLSLKQAEEAPARPPRERRPSKERPGYDRSQAIQEPEGGIDNTLAAAFAQVRLQIAEQDAAAPEPEAAEVVDAIGSADAEPGSLAPDDAAAPEPEAAEAEPEVADAIGSVAAEPEVEPAEVDGAAEVTEVSAEVDPVVSEAAEAEVTDVVEPAEAEAEDATEATDKA